MPRKRDHQTRLGMTPEEWERVKHEAERAAAHRAAQDKRVELEAPALRKYCLKTDARRWLRSACQYDLPLSTMEQLLDWMVQVRGRKLTAQDTTRGRQLLRRHRGDASAAFNAWANEQRARQEAT